MERIFLWAAAIGLTPIALGYGVDPERSMWALFALSVDTVNLTHIFRAVMGLYLALAVFWVAGALRPALRLPALWSLVVFMFGLAAGRMLSLILDGWPHWLLVGYMCAEIGFGVVGLRLIQARAPSGVNAAEI